MAVERLCPVCGKSHKVKRITKVYCSPQCRDIAAYAKKRKLIVLPEHHTQHQQSETPT